MLLRIVERLSLLAPAQLQRRRQALAQVQSAIHALGDPARLQERLALYNQAEEIAVQQVGWLPLFYPQASVLIRPSVRGLIFTSVGIIAPDWSAVRVEAAQ